LGVRQWVMLVSHRPREQRTRIIMCPRSDKERSESIVKKASTRKQYEGLRKEYRRTRFGQGVRGNTRRPSPEQIWSRLSRKLARVQRLRVGEPRAPVSSEDILLQSPATSIQPDDVPLEPKTKRVHVSVSTCSRPRGVLSSPNGGQASAEPVAFSILATLCLYGSLGTGIGTFIS
jgi:hypothetical protein